MDFKTPLVRQLVKTMSVGSKWLHLVECHGNSPFGLKKGESYKETLSVYQIKRVRKQWEEPGKEIILEVDDDDGTKGYGSIITSAIGTLEVGDDKIVLTYENNPKVTSTYTRV